MKKLIALAFVLPVALAAQEHEKACDVFSRVNFVLQQAHIKPKPIDDSLSVYVFNSVMEQLDDNNSLFLKEDYDLLAKHKYKIDDYLTGKDCSFFNEFIVTYRKALQRNKKFIEQVSLENFTNSKDTIFYSRTSFPYHTDPQRIKKYIRKKMAYDAFEDIARLSKNKDSLRPLLPKLLPASKNKITEAYLCRVNTLLDPTEGFEQSFYNLFFSTFCSYFDPHSTYFSYNDKASFMSTIATENYSLGLYVSQNQKEQVIIEEIIPGGPAYKTHKISKGDQLLKLAANEKEYAVSCASMETINNIVISDTYRNVELTLRKQDGTVYSVKLEKAIMKSEDHSVYSFVLGDTTPVGYIKIPSFYTALDGNTSGCAQDVAEEVEKLRREGVKALVIDLQFNGGGSMEEVIRMATLFIDHGPLAIIKGTGKTQEIISDKNKGTVFNGPIVVLVNGFSASASEFFAGVMQDYNRALIAGSTTMGKATMQTILPLEGSNNEFVKVTIDKFYRVTGKSSQYTGIVPDVVMPSFFDKLLQSERTLPNAMENDRLPVELKHKSLPDDQLKKAAEISRGRVEANAYFKLMQSVNNELHNLQRTDKPALPITFDNVFKDVHSMDKIWKQINSALDNEQDIKIKNTTALTDVIADDEFLTSINEQKLKSLKTDACIAEAYRIAVDLYNLRISKVVVSSN